MFHLIHPNTLEALILLGLSRVEHGWITLIMFHPNPPDDVSIATVTLT
jgi:hypothetical protein